ncbi:porin [Vibrio tapetis subsp. quintayensis]|uniref:porin n=1 Tax=Vibrio tapetis TaxID=52443 RepID=UPI0025B52539|nr:porin [Vibrio tapetis]MDN3682901.1 porin [Vibrio tapetis subsp. quintayensis]
MNKLNLSIITLALFSAGSAFAAHTFTNENGDTLTLDGRFEARYQQPGEGQDSKWNSGSSRFGLKGTKQLDNGWQGFGHAEWGYNSQSDKSDIYDRLLYAGVEHDTYGKIAAGTKQWSTFYDVAWFTDMGRTYGTRGSGVYNLSDWGISSGTGRAANSITYRNSINEQIKYGFTYQTTRTDVALNSNIKATLKNGLGASALYKLNDQINIGFAYHQNEMTDLDTGTNIQNGDTARLALLGANYSDGSLYVGATYSQGNNWEITDQNYFFDSRGAEIYTYYHLDGGFRPTFNVNYMSDTDGRANGYERLTLIPGVEYHFSKNTFIVWAEYQFDQGSDKFEAAKYQNRDDQFSAGIRYYF